MASQANFNLTLDDPELRKDPGVRKWLLDVKRRMAEHLEICPNCIKRKAYKSALKRIICERPTKTRAIKIAREALLETGAADC
jgi:hypothetical protein